MTNNPEPILIPDPGESPAAIHLNGLTWLGLLVPVPDHLVERLGKGEIDAAISRSAIETIEALTKENQ